MPPRAHAGASLDEERVCPECGGDRLVRDDIHGEVICAACGVVTTERAIDEGPEWAAYSMEENERLARTGPPRRVLTGASGLMTVIPFATTDIRGGKIPPQSQATFHHLRWVQHIVGQYRPGERSSAVMKQALDHLASRMDLPRTVRDEAGFICQKAVQRGLVRGRSVEGIVAAAVYAACRVCGVPRTLDELQKATGLKKKPIARDYRRLLQIHALRLVPLPRPQDYVDRFCSELGLSGAVRTEALQVLKELDRILPSRSLLPAGTAAAAIYVAAQSCGETRAQKVIAKVAGVTEVTIRSRLPLLRGFKKPFAVPRQPVLKLSARASSPS